MTGETRDLMDDIFREVSAGRLDVAESLCRQSLQRSPDDVNLLGMLGAILLKTARTDEARTLLERTVALEPAFPKPHEDLGLLHLECGEPLRALACFETALALDMSQVAARRGLVVALQRLGRHQEAHAAATRFGILSPTAQALAEADSLRRQGKLPQAEKICQDVIAGEPENVGALRLMAIIAADDERHVVAEGLLRRIVKLQPENVAAMQELGRFLGDLGRYPEAIEILEQALLAGTHSADIQVLLGDMLGIVGRSEEALEAYEKCLAISADDAAALTGRGHMLRIAGRADEAIASYRRSLEVAPANGEGWWNLASMHGLEFSDDDVAEMRKTVDADALSEESTVGLRFALARALEQRQDFAGAWDQYRQGNSIKRGLVRYDPVETEVLHRQLQDTLTRDLFDRNRLTSENARTPIFILGMPRSGSTLVEQILASHSAVEGAGELPYIIMMSRTLGAGSEDGVRYPEILDTLDVSQLTGLGKAYLYHTEMHCRAGAPYFTDKMPANHAHVGMIKLILPHAKVIDVRRHPLATCVANYRTLFAQGKNHSYDLAELGEYYLQYLDIMNHWDRVLPGEVLHVQYEDVVANLEVEVRRILDFCDLPFEDACLRYYESRRPVNTASSEQVRQPIYASAVEFWRNYEPHLGELKEILGPVL